MQAKSLKTFLQIVPFGCVFSVETPNCLDKIHIERMQLNILQFIIPNYTSKHFFMLLEMPTIDLTAN